jgi:hypothetical protein
LADWPGEKSLKWPLAPGAAAASVGAMFVDPRPARSPRAAPPTLLACAVLALLAIWTVPAHAQDADDAADPPAGPLRQSPDDAWWTGPMLSNSAATLPKGHALIESYAFDQIQGDASLYGSLTYLLYGVTDTLTVGAKPMFGAASGTGGRLRAGVGDLTLSAQYRLTSPKAPPGKPTIAVSLQYSLPTGRYDRLDTQPGVGLGSGAHATTLSLYAQQYFWLPNGHIFRARLNIASSWLDKARIDGASVYGTAAGFAGRASSGQRFDVGVSGEYSISRNWVLGLDLVTSRTAGTKVSGTSVSAGGSSSTVRFDLPQAQSWGVAPAIEYSWRPNLGVLLAARFIPRGQNVSGSVTPAVAINWVL